MKNQVFNYFTFGLFYFVFTLQCSIVTFAQQPILDSLYSIWQDNTQSDSVRVLAFNRYIYKGFLEAQPDSAAVLAEELIDFATERNYERGKALGWGILGDYYSLVGDFSKGQECYELSIISNEKIGNKKGIANSLFSIGLDFIIQSDYPRALDFNNRALAISEEINDQKGISDALSNIGTIYHSLGYTTEALEYFERAVIMSEKMGDDMGIAITLVNIGAIYFEQKDMINALKYFEQSLAIEEKIGYERGMALTLGNIGSIHKAQGDYPNAQTMFDRSLAIYEKSADKFGIEGLLISMGDLENDQGNFDKALNHYQRSFSIAEKIGNQQDMAKSLNSMGNLFYSKMDYSKSLYYCKQGLELAEIVSVLIAQRTSCQCLYNTYKALGKGNEALVYLEKIGELDNQLNKAEITKQLHQMEFRQALLQDSIAKAEEARLILVAHQNEVRRKNHTKNIALGGGLFFLLLAGGFYSRWHYVRKSKAVLQVEKDRSESLLLNILPTEIAEELKEKGRADARDFEKVSILFTDFIGFTEVSANLSAALLVNEINVCFEAFDAIIDKFDIEKIKTIGDAYMAAGGLPVPTDNSAKNTVLAALEMQAFITNRKVENETTGKPAFEMRVGIHTGPVVAGIVGVKKFQYDIWGDTVNTASRMESAGEVGKVNISRSTYDYLRDDSQFTFESRGKITVKGKGEVEMWFVENTQSR